MQLEAEGFKQLHFLFAAEQDDLHFIIAVGHDDLGHHIPHKSQNRLPVADHAADKIVDQRGHNRRVMQQSRILDDLVHARLQRIFLDREALLGAVKGGEHGVIPVADADLQKVIVHVPAFPEPLLGIRPAHDLVDRGIGIQKDPLLFPALVPDLLFLGLQIGRVFFLALLFVLIALFFGIALGQKRHHKAGRGHEEIPRHQRVSAHQRRAAHAQEEGDLIAADGGRRIVKHNGLRLHRLPLSGGAIEKSI